MEIQMICFDDYLQWHTLPWWSLLELETCLHIFCTTKWLIWGILSVDPSIRIQKPKQGVLWYLWTWGTQKHHTKFWDVQKRSSRGEENFCKKGKVKKGKERRENFCTSLTLELFGAVFSLYDGHFQCFLLGMKWRICIIALHKQGLFLTSCAQLIMLNKWAWREAENSELDIVQSSLHLTGEDAQDHTEAVTFSKTYLPCRTSRTSPKILLTPTGQAESRVGNLSLGTVELVKNK